MKKHTALRLHAQSCEHGHYSFDLLASPAAHSHPSLASNDGTHIPTTFHVPILSSTATAWHGPCMCPLHQAATLNAYPFCQFLCHKWQPQIVLLQSHCAFGIGTQSTPQSLLLPARHHCRQLMVPHALSWHRSLCPSHAAAVPAPLASSHVPRSIALVDAHLGNLWPLQAATRHRAQQRSPPQVAQRAALLVVLLKRPHRSRRLCSHVPQRPRAQDPLHRVATRSMAVVTSSHARLFARSSRCFIAVSTFVTNRVLARRRIVCIAVAPQGAASLRATRCYDVRRLFTSASCGMARSAGSSASIGSSHQQLCPRDVGSAQAPRSIVLHWTGGYRGPLR